MEERWGMEVGGEGNKREEDKGWGRGMKCKGLQISAAPKKDSMRPWFCRRTALLLFGVSATFQGP